jgi:hypothetical protein
MNEWPIAFQTKDFIGVLLLLVATGGATLAMIVSQRVRELALFVIAGGAVLTERMDINMYSAYWYRGTTRGFEMTLLDVLALSLLMSTVLVPRHGQARIYWPAGLGPMLLFVTGAGVSVALATPQIFGWYELSKLVRGVVFFLAAAHFVRRERELTLVVLGLCASALLEGATSIRQRLFEGIYRPTGTLDHPNSVSMYLCLTGPVLLAASASELPAWVRRIAGLAAGVAAVTVLLTLSRAGIPAFGAAMLGVAGYCGLLRFNLRNVMVAGCASVALLVVVMKSWDMLVERYESASLGEEYLDGKGETRGYYFRQAGVMLESQPFGVGLNNWSYWVSKKYGALAGMRYQDYDDITFAPPSETLYMYVYAAPAHNVGVLTAGELGWWGLGLFLLMWLRWFSVGAKFLRGRDPAALSRLGVGICFGCVGVFLQSFTEWTFRQTQIFITFHLLVGVLASLRHQQQLAREPEPEALPLAADAPVEV